MVTALNPGKLVSRLGKLVSRLSELVWLGKLVSRLSGLVSLSPGGSADVDRTGGGVYGPGRRSSFSRSSHVRIGPPAPSFSDPG